jgi:hypothetical protein
MKVTIAVLAGVILAGCTQPLLMRNPTTGETVDCGSLYSYEQARREEACVRDYRAQGWVRVPK